jgi:NADH dehydrogenase/NADH:ubiquinone oxidoreductase subunit G
MGEDAIEAGNRGSNTVIGTYGGWLDCSQCGNCIEVCPTGTLLDGVYRHETRPWELEQTISTDTYSSDGMQLSIGSRGGAVHRIVARDRYVNGLNGEFPRCQSSVRSRVHKSPDASEDADDPLHEKAAS